MATGSTTCTNHGGTPPPKKTRSSESTHSRICQLIAVLLRSARFCRSVIGAAGSSSCHSVHSVLVHAAGLATGSGLHTLFQFHSAPRSSVHFARHLTSRFFFNEQISFTRLCGSSSMLVPWQHQLRSQQLLRSTSVFFFWPARCRRCTWNSAEHSCQSAATPCSCASASAP